MRIRIRKDDLLIIVFLGISMEVGHFSLGIPGKFIGLVSAVAAFVLLFRKVQKQLAGERSKDSKIEQVESPAKKP